mmetsp:Transcript_8075/g.27049  ORF Transcript_8075/g.27049 Transcript_8075/m.27049 type:complete len:153 (-) Transcript_8075:757-1215(-)
MPGGAATMAEKVDLALDDVVKMDKSSKGKPRGRGGGGRGGAIRSGRGGNVGRRPAPYARRGGFGGGGFGRPADVFAEPPTGGFYMHDDRTDPEPAAPKELSTGIDDSGPSSCSTRALSTCPVLWKLFSVSSDNSWAQRVCIMFQLEDGLLWL